MSRRDWIASITVGLSIGVVIGFLLFGAVADAKTLFRDDFDGRHLSHRKWFVNDTGRGHVHYGPQGDTAYKGSQVKLRGGVAKLRLSPRSYAGQRYTGTRIDTLGKFQFRYGWVKARMKLSYGKTPWANFWTNGRNWPSTGEIDIVETLGCNCNPRAIIHSGNGQGGGRIGEAFYRRPDTVWRTYAMHWTRRGVTFVYNGRRIGHWSGRISAKHHLILGLQGPLYGESYREDRVAVDWVRVWR
jgi:beta-glucanase (GH16 family)